MNKLTRKITLILDGYAPKETLVELIPTQKSKRILRAVKSLLIFWSCAALSAFIPMLHFILVPGFFASGLLFAANSFFDDVQLHTRFVPCLKCGAEAEFKNLADYFPKWAYCSSCGAELRIELVKN